MSLRAASAALAALAAGACTTISEVSRPVSEKIGFATTVPKAQDFVEQSRKESPGDYISVGVTPPSRSDKPMTPDELKKAEADLQSTLVSHDKLAGLPPPKADDPKKPKQPLPKKQGEKAPASQ
jgi:hypothetical protein